MAATLVISHANVITMDGKPIDPAQAIAMDKDRILAVGTDQEIQSLIGAETTVLSLFGRTVLPGFIDTHVHFTQTGLGALGPSVHDVTSAEEVLDVVASAAAQVEKGKLLLVHGATIGGFDQPVNRHLLDQVAPDHLTVIGDVGGHACIVNTSAWQSLRFPLDTQGIRRDPQSGEPNGLLVGIANNIARFHFWDMIEDSTRVAALNRAAAMAAENGITTVHALDGGTRDIHSWLPQRDVETLLEKGKDLAVRSVVYFQSTNVRQALEFKLPRIGGCIYVDGAYEEHTAALLEPYSDDPTSHGVLYFSDSELDDFVGQAHRAGLQISMHAIGDAAIDQLLGAYERALRNEPRADHRHRIEHFSLPTPQHVDKAAQLGVALAMQPNFAVMPEGSEKIFQVAGIRLLGPERYKRRHPYRKIVDAGILVAAGSDSDAKPMGPMEGIHAVVNHPDEERRLTVFEALELYTINGAKIAFEEKDKGTLQPGKFGDLVVLSDNPLKISPKRIKDIAVEMTIVGGKVVYDARNKGKGI